MVSIIILTIIGYLIGSISPSFIFAKFKGFNIKNRGSKNCGASNAYITMGIKYGIAVFLIDFLKVFVAVLIAKIFFNSVKDFHLITGFSCILGHIFPFYLKFKGGKGFSCLIACMFLINPIFAVIVLVLSLSLAGISNYIVVATLLCLILTSIFLPVFEDFSIVPTIYGLISTFVIFVKHIPNIVKILKGEEFLIFKNKPPFFIFKKSVDHSNNN